MYTLDEFIERLKELRGIVEKGGETPVVIAAESNYGDECFEPAAVEIQNAMKPFKEDDQVWISKDDGNTEQVISIF